MLAEERESREGSRKGGGSKKFGSKEQSIVDVEEELEIEKDEEGDVVFMNTREWAKGSEESASSSKGKKGKGESKGIKKWILPVASCDDPLTKLFRGFSPKRIDTSKI